MVWSKQAEGIWLWNLEADLRSFPMPDYARSKQVYVAMGVVKYIKSVVFLLENYIARKSHMTNMFLNIVSGIRQPVKLAWRGVREWWEAACADDRNSRKTSKIDSNPKKYISSIVPSSPCLNIVYSKLGKPQILPVRNIAGTPSFQELISVIGFSEISRNVQLSLSVLLWQKVSVWLHKHEDTRLRANETPLVIRHVPFQYYAIDLWCAGGTGKITCLTFFCDTSNSKQCAHEIFGVRIAFAADVRQ